MAKKMTVEFMVEFGEDFVSDMEYKIVDGYTSPEPPFYGYDIYRVETDDFKKIVITDDISGIDYVADKVEKFPDGIYYVTEWMPITEEEI